ncbi:MAG: galactose oxidase [Bacteroidales bacterium]|nr:galactose oxidase [Bacteroidales bacterium]
MKHNCILIIIIALFILLLWNCNKDEDDSTELIGNWVELSDFEGVPRSDAVAFAIDDKGYVGTGYDGDIRLSDFWEYNSEKDTWLQKADFPGSARNGAVGMATDTKGYIGTGYDGLKKLKDFWEYDPDSNLWTQKADFGGSERYAAVGMTINNKCYIGTGFDGNYLKDFWMYDPETDTWEQKVSVGGSKRRDAAGFVINGKGYIMTGINNGSYETDMWKYDPETDSWDEMNEIANVTDKKFDDDYSSIYGIGKVAFTINGKGYLATAGSGVSGTVWEYDPTTDLWEQKTSLEGSTRVDATGFAIGDHGYITTGHNSSYYFDDIWAFHPNDEYDDQD